jgi:hypothetical protein
MAQTYTLDEAAVRLGITPEEMKRRLKDDWKTLRSFRDGPTLRFRATDIDELARSLGAASDPSLQLAPLPETPAPGSDDFKVPDLSIAGKVDDPLVFESSGSSTEEDNIFSLSVDDPRAKGKGKGDSDVRLEVAGPKSDKHKKGDSDARLDAPKPKKSDSDARLKAKDKGKEKAKKDDQAVVQTEEIAVDFSGPGSAVIKGGGSSAKLSAPKSSTKLSSGSDSGRGLGNPGVGDSSEFELSLDADSSDFELQLNADPSSSDEVDLGSSPVDEKAKSGQSGINLRDPADSGISLEKKGAGKPKSSKEPDTDSDSDVDFELSLEGPMPGGSGPKLGGPRSGPRGPVTSDSDSEFELTLDDSGEGSSLEAAALESDAGKNDIFETDFEIPPMDSDSESGSGSEAVAVESDTDLEQSDFDLAVEGDSGSDETGSQVVLLEEEEESPKPARGRRKPAAAADVDVDLDSGEADVAVEDEEGSAATALRGARDRRRDVDEEEEEEGTTTAVAAPAPWGPIPAVFLFLAFFPMMLGGLMGYELIHTAFGYQQTKKPAAPIVRGVANTLDMDVKDQ